MNELSRNKIILMVLVLSCFGASWFLQSSLLFNSDTSWLMLVTKRLLAGGNYTHDFFEINPPMILYIYTPAVCIGKVLNLATYHALCLYVFLLVAISLTICNKVLPKIFSVQQIFVTNAWLITLAALLLIMPMSEFGQRDHLVVIFTMPYFLLMAWRLQKGLQPPAAWAFFIGAFAALGFIIKPFFLAPLLFTEIYYLYHERSLRAVLRAENYAIASVFTLFLLLILIFNYDYLTTIMPMVSQFYYGKYRFPLLAMVGNEEVIFAYFALIFYFLRARFQTMSALTTVLMLATCGFLLAFFLQQTLWFYHTIPVFMTTSLLFTLLFCLLIQQEKFTRAEYVSLLGFGLFMAGFLIWHMPYISMSLGFFPAAYFSLFSCVFLLMFSATGKSPAHSIFYTILVIEAGIGIYSYLIHSPLQIHMFILTSLLMMLLFTLFIPQKAHRAKLRFTQLMILGSMIATIPFYQPGYLYDYSQAYKTLYLNLLTTLKAYPKQRIIFFSSIADFSFPALDYTNQTLASRFAGLGWVPALSFNGDAQSYEDAYQKSRSRNEFFIHALVDDLRQRQPDVVLVDMRNTDKDGMKRYFGSQQMDFIKFFSQNSEFKNIWQQYHYVKTVDGQPLFKFNIYLRNPSV
jgi:hypothetical protein